MPVEVTSTMVSLSLANSAPAACRSSYVFLNPAILLIRATRSGVSLWAFYDDARGAIHRSVRQSLVFCWHKVLSLKGITTGKSDSSRGSSSL